MANLAVMSEKKRAYQTGQCMTYNISSLGPGSWFVDSPKGTSGYSFHTLAEAERFAITLARRNTPSKVCTLDSGGEIVDELVFDEPTDSGR
jgi:hypothetical protein